MPAPPMNKIKNSRIPISHFKIKAHLYFCRQSDGIISSLFHLLVIPKNLLEIPLNELAQAGNGHDINPSARLQMFFRVFQEDP